MASTAERPLVERLEGRCLLASPAGLSPDAIRAAYGIDSTSFHWGGATIPADGRGQTIALVVAGDAPTIQQDFQFFNNTFGLPNTTPSGQPSLSVVKLNHPAPDAGWAMEAALDVQWAHAIAPAAKLVLVEAGQPTLSGMMSAVDYARNIPGVSVVSMSWGGDPSLYGLGYDSYFSTPKSHPGPGGIPGGVTFVAASGDSGAPATWPANSPSVLSVGGTTLSLGNANVWRGETGWSGSGGGPDATTRRALPLVAANADPASGVAIYDSYQAAGQSPWVVVGGTSASAPLWAGIIALVDQGRAIRRLGSLNTLQTIRAIRRAPSSIFHDITSGNNGYPAKTGYDFVTGRGSPIANVLVSRLLRISRTSNSPTPAFQSTKPIVASLSRLGLGSTLLRTFHIVNHNPWANGTASVTA